MLSIHRIVPGRLEEIDAKAIAPNAGDRYWLDIVGPTPQDREHIERARGVRLPALEDVEEIEATSRFFIDDDGVHLRVWFLDLQGREITAHPVAFILSEDCLISLSWERVGSFDQLRRNRRLGNRADSPAAVFLRLVEIQLDDIADDLQALYEEIESHWNCPDRPDYDLLEQELSHICRLEGNKHRLRFVLMDLQKVLGALDREERVPTLLERRFAAARSDVDSLLIHFGFISEKLDFLMDMIVSRLNLVDNRVSKILSVVALVFLPPTLIGAIYGMNFHYMPELQIPWAYPATLAAMLASAVVPYLVFKWKRWL